MGELLRLMEDPLPLRRDSARLRKDSVPLRSIVARLSVGDLTSPVDLASPEVRMNPRIELPACFPLSSFSLSLDLGSFFTVVSCFVAETSFVVVESFSLSLAVGILLSGVVLEDAREVAIDFTCEVAVGDRSPEGVEMT
jgi:hypothetical protein